MNSSSRPDTKLVEGETEEPVLSLSKEPASSSATEADVREVIQPRRAILAMPEYHPPLAGRTALRLDFNENTHAPSPRVREALGSLTLESFTVYPERAPVEAIVAQHLGLKPEQVLLTNAVDEAIHIICFTFLEEGDECLFAVPSFFMYDVSAMGMGATVVRVQADETLAFPFERFLAAITPQTKLIILTTPNNPTGAITTREQIYAIANAAPHAVILVDEAYFHFHGETVMDDLIEPTTLDCHPERSEAESKDPLVEAAAEPFAPLLGEADGWVPQNILVARTFSKAYGLANLRVGLIAGPTALMQHLRKASSPYNVNGIALAAVKASIGDTEYIDWYVTQMREGRARIERALDNMKVPYWRSHANFVLMHIGPRHKEFVQGMRDRGVLVRDRSSDPGLAGCVRITVGVEDQTTTGIAALRDTLAAMNWTAAEVTKPGPNQREHPTMSNPENASDMHIAPDAFTEQIPGYPGLPTNRHPERSAVESKDLLSRTANLTRNTTETQIQLTLNLDGQGAYTVRTGIRFFDHMLELFTRHGGFDLDLTCNGDLDVDQHHTVEDVGIALGEAFDSAIGDKKGILRAGYFVMAMDETLAVAAIDLSGRTGYVVDDQVTVPLVGDFQTELTTDFFDGFARGGRCNVHVKTMYGRSNHHKIEAIFKAFARALRGAVSRDERMKDLLPSTKGLL